LSTARHLSLLGWDELQQKKFGDAELLFQKALRHSAADERANWGMSEVLWEQNSRQQAVDFMSTAVEISGDNPELLVRLGEMHFAEGQFEEALAQADAALGVQRQHFKAWALRGKVLHRSGRYDEALDAYHRALNEQPNYPEVQLALADIYQSLGRSQRALHTLKRMVDGANGVPMPAQAWLIKGQALADLGEVDDARLCYQSAVQCADEADTELLVELAESQMAFGDLAAARHSIGRAISYDPYNPDVQRVKVSLDESAQGYATVSTLIGYGQPPQRPASEPEK
jgi:tetratricopeptide (TPR) repeat protein